MLERLNGPAFRGRLAVLAALGLSLALSAGLAAPSTAQDEAARTEALRARVEALSAEAQRVEDINAITRIQRAYGYYVDKGFWNEAADLFAEDGTLEIGVDGVYRGKERVRQAIIAYGEGRDGTGPGLPYGQINHRMQLSPVVTIADDGVTAYGRWKEFALLGHYKVEAKWGDATVENVYVKEDGVWKIQAMRIYTNFVAPYQGGWAALEPVEGDWKSEVAERLPPDAPPTATYEPFPNVFVPPFHYDLETPARVADLSASEPGEGDIGALEAAADQIAARIAIAASERAIENLQAQYGYYVDKGLWTEAASLFAENGTYEFGQSGVYVGRDRVKDGLSLMGPEGLEEGQLNNYPMMQPIVTVAPDNQTAVARWRSDVMLSRDGKGRWGGGLWLMSYVNEGGVWKIASLKYNVVMWGDYDEGWTAKPFPMDPPSTTNPPDQPPTEVYASLPTAHFTPYHYENPVTHGTPIQSIEIPDVSGRRLNRIADDLAEIERRAIALVDLTAVERLQHTYGYYVDQAQWHDVADLWAEDGTLEIGGRGVFLGKERVREYMLTAFGQPGRADGLLIDHQQFQVLATINPDGRTAEARATAFVMSSGGWGDCYYENDYEKIDGVWHMKVLHGPFNMYAGYELGWVDRVITNTYPEKFGVPPDLPPSVVYLAYPSYYAEPFHYPNPVTGRWAPAPDPAAGGEAFGRIPSAR
jgi:hypothetical protein